MRTRPRILLDIDGFFANFIDASLPVIKSIVLQRKHEPHSWRAWVESVGHEDVKSYHMEEIFAMTPEEIRAWHAHVKAPGYCAAIRPYPGARECIAELKAIGDIHPVTFPWPKAPHWIIEREEWLADELGIDPDLVVYTRQKHLVAGDIFCEDTTKYLVQWREHHLDGIAIRMRRPYNLKEPFVLGVTVNNFVDLVREIKAVVDMRERHHRSLWDNI